MTRVLTETREFNEGVRRLAQYRPFDNRGRNLEAVVLDLVLAAAELNDGEFASLQECKDAIKTLWTIEFEIDEIRCARDTLVEQGLAASTRGGFSLDDSARHQLQRTAANADAAEEEALVQWETTTREARPDLSADDMEDLRADLSEWLGKIVARHGAEATLILYPEDERAHRLFAAIEGLGTDFLPQRSEAVMAVREEAMKSFVRQPTPEQRSLLANRLNTAFYLTVLTLDPEARPLAEQKARGTRIYLDTNFIYAVLGMAPTQESLSAHRLLEITHELGYQLAVTRWTIDEMHHSIERARKNVEVHGTTFNQGLARLMIQVTGEKGATRTYWESFLDEGISVKDFFERVSAFEDELPKFNIEVVEEGCSKVDDRQELVSEYADLFNSLIWPGYRHREVLEHDAKHRLLVERLRGEGATRFSTAKCWFLTQDSKLPKFAGLMPNPEEDPPKLPFCLSPSAWVQIVRAMTPRTDDFEQMVVELLTSPFVGFRGPLDQRLVREVVARMDQYDDASPELALAVVQDSAVMGQIEETSDADMEEAVRAAYSTKAKELREQAEESARIAAEERTARREAERRERETKKDLVAERRRREGAESDTRSIDRKLAEEAEARERSAERHDAELAALKQELEDERNERQRDRANRRRDARIAAGVAIGLVGVAAAAVALIFGLVQDTVGVMATVVAGGLMSAVGLNLALGKEKGSLVLNVLSYLAGIIGIALAILLSHSS